MADAAAMADDGHGDHDTAAIGDLAVGGGGGAAAAAVAAMGRRGLGASSPMATCAWSSST